MSDTPGFEDYLSAKKIDSVAFRQAEPEVWNAWKVEFEQMHPNSFTVQKLNLINAIRRKYLRADLSETKSAEAPGPEPVPPPRPGPPRPVIKPRPKIG